MTMYREKIILAYKHLLEVHEELFTRIVNIGMTGTYREVNKLFEAGDSFRFEMEMFRNIEDKNLEELIAFFDQLEELMNSMAATNDLTKEDLEDD